MPFKNFSRTDWLKQYFLSAESEFVEMITIPQSLQFLAQNKYLLTLLRYVENLQELSEPQILKTCLLFVQLLRSNKKKIKNSLEDYVFKDLTFFNISLPENQRLNFYKIIEQIGQYLDILKEREVDLKNELNLFLKICSLNYALNKSKNQYILNANILLCQIISQRFSEIWKTMKGQIQICNQLSDEDFLQFYQNYSLFCSVRKKMSNKQKKGIEINLEKNISIEKKYQQITLNKQLSQLQKQNDQSDFYGIPKRNVAKLINMYDFSDEQQ